MSQTPLFQSHQCLSTSAQSLFRQICNQDGKCVQQITSYCQDSNFTPQDFQKHVQTLACWQQSCPTKEESCMKQCAQRAYHAQ